MSMPTLFDSDCVKVYRKWDMLNEQAVAAGWESPLWGEAYVTDFIVDDGLGHDLEGRQFVRFDGQAYRVTRYESSSELDGRYRYWVEKVFEPGQSISPIR
jgi:hypothetical protein